MTAVNTNEFHLVDSKREDIKGSFYTEELQEVKRTDVFLVDEVLKQRGKGAKKEQFMSWLGSPSSANSRTSAGDAIVV